MSNKQAHTEFAISFFVINKMLQMKFDKCIFFLDNLTMLSATNKSVVLSALFNTFYHEEM